MRIGSYNHIACNCKTFFRKKGMLYSHLSYLKIIGYLILFCKLSHALTMLRRLDILIRDKMIRHKRYLILIKHTCFLHLIHLMDSYRRCYIIAKNKIKICFNKLSCFYIRKTCMRCKNLLCHRHTHNNSSFLFISPNNPIGLICCYLNNNTFSVILKIHIIYSYYNLQL